MNWDAIGAIAEVCGALAVLATLIYLALQIKQQSEVTRAQVHQQRADSVSQLIAAITNNEENFELVKKIMKSGGLESTDFSEDEQFRGRVILAPLRANLENTYNQYKNGFISEELYQDVMMPLCASYGQPMIEFGMPFTKSFKEEMKRILQAQSGSR